MTGAMPRLALFEPDIPQNAGAIARLCACLGAPLHIIEPAGFDASDRNFRRAGIDYFERAVIVRHPSWSAFDSWRRDEGARLLLATTKGSSHLDWAYAANDVLLLGRESAGVPEEVHSAADARLIVPMRGGLRSLNVAVAAALILGEACADRRLPRAPMARRRAPAIGTVAKRTERPSRRLVSALRDRICASFEAIESEAPGPFLMRRRRLRANSSARPGSEKS